MRWYQRGFTPFLCAVENGVTFRVISVLIGRGCNVLAKTDVRNNRLFINQ